MEWLTAAVGVFAYASVVLVLWGVFALSIGFGIGQVLGAGAAACFVGAAVLGARRRSRESQRGMTR